MADEVIVTTDSAADEGVAFAEGLAMGVAAEAAQQASEQAQAAQVEATLATAAVRSTDEQLAELRAVVVGLHDQMQEGFAGFAEAIMMLTEEDEIEAEAIDELAAETAAAEVEAASAEADVTEIVEEHAAEAETESQETAADGDSNAPETADDGESASDGGTGHPERAGGRVRFRRGRR